MTKNLALSVLALCAGCAGCAGVPTAPPKPVEVNVAVPVSCVKARPVRPAYETESLPATATDGQTVAALARDWGRSRLYESTLETTVAGCM